MKKFISAILTALMLPLAPALAEGGEGVSVLLNGAPMTFADAEPKIVDGRVMLPFRSVLERLGADIGYNNASREVTAVLRGHTLSFSLDAPQIYADGSKTPAYVMDVPPLVEDGRTLVPLRALGEAAGLTVGWDNNRRAALLTDKAAARTEIERACPALNDLLTLLRTSVGVYSHDETLRVEAAGLTITAEGSVDADGETRRAEAAVTVEGAGRAESGSAEVIVTRESLYFKTDIFPRLAGIAPAAWVSGVAADTWYRADWGELEEMLSGADGGTLRAAAIDLIDGGDDLASLEGLLSGLFDGLDTDSAASAEELARGIAAAKQAFGPDALGVSHRPDGSDEVWLNADGDVISYLTEGRWTSLSYGATYSGGAAVTGRIAIKTADAAISSEIRQGRALFAEKTLLPDEAVNFVDTLYTILHSGE